MHQREESQKQKGKVYRYRLQHKLHLLVSEQVFIWFIFLYIYMVSVSDFEHVFVCWERYFRIRITIAVVLNLECFIQQTNTHSQSATGTLKQDVKCVKSQQERLCFFIVNL